MQCLETTVGAEAYFMILSLVVGALMNLVKRIKFVPGDAVPALAFVLGWTFDAAAGNFTCDLSYAEASLSGLGGGLAGLAAAGGHEALSRTLHTFGLGALGDRLLGRAKEEKAKREKKSTKKGTTALIVLLALSLTACSSLLPALSKAAQGAQYLGTVIEVADAGASAYFARHPSLENEQRVDEAIRKAHGALVTLNAALATAEAASDKDVVKAREEAITAYKALRDLLSELGVLSATPPMGGAETDAPQPQPFALPEAGAVL